MAKQYDAIILGGGVIGCSIAYSLSKKGQSVLLLEKDRIASQASSAAAGMLGVQTEMEENGPLFELACKSRSMFPALAEELREITGMDISLMRKGMLKLAVKEEQIHQFEEILKWQKSKGEDAVWLGKEELLQTEPSLSDEVLGGLYFPGEGHVSAPELSQAFGLAARAYGAKCREFTEVKSVIFNNGKAVGVSTNAGHFLGNAIVVAGGAWSRHFLPNGEEAMYPVKGEALSLKMEAPFLKRTIFTEDCYLVPKKGGELIIGATSKPYTFDRKVTVAGVSTLMEKAKELVPMLATAEVNHMWAGTRPMTMDGLPFLGEHPEIKHLYFATGHYRNGILLSPITGEILSNLIVGEEMPEVDLASFCPGRYQQKQEVGML